jgi:hypothetical protein
VLHCTCILLTPVPSHPFAQLGTIRNNEWRWLFWSSAGVRRPFWDKRVNKLDCFCCVVIMLHLIASLYFNNPEFILTEEAEKLDLLLFSIDVIAIIAILALFVVVLAEGFFKRNSIHIMTSAISRTVIQLQVELRARQDEFLKAVDAGMESSGLGDQMVHFDVFHQAAEQCLMSAGIAPRAWTIQAVFFVLKLIHDDDDEHSLYMSPELRKELASVEGQRLPKYWVRLILPVLRLAVAFSRLG